MCRIAVELVVVVVVAETIFAGMISQSTNG